MGKLRTTIIRASIATVVVGAIAAASVAATATTEPAAVGPSGAPDTQTLAAFGAFDDDSVPGIDADAYARIRQLLPERDESNSSPAQGRLTREDLGPASQGRQLLHLAAGHELSAVRMAAGEICFTTTLAAGAIVTGCNHELNTAGISPGGAWTRSGQVLFGLANDTVETVEIRTNAGVLEPAAMGDNAYLWDSGDAARTTYGTAVRVTHHDGSVDEVTLADEGDARRAPAA